MLSPTYSNSNSLNSDFLFNNSNSGYYKNLPRNLEKSSKYCDKCYDMKTLKYKCKKHKQMKAGAIILDIEKESILLIKGNYANKWNVPKGTSDDNESIRNTAMREIKEETGVHIDISKYDIPVKIYKVFLYIKTISKQTIINPLDKQEIQDAKWFSITELNKLEGKTTLLKKVINYLDNNKFN